MRAVNADGTGAPSAEVSATPATVPSAPLGFAASGGPGTVRLTWVAPGNGGAAITGYKVYRSMSSGTSSGTEGLVATLGNVTPWDDPVVAGTYYCEVSAVNPLAKARAPSKRPRLPRRHPLRRHQQPHRT